MSGYIAMREGVAARARVERDFSLAHMTAAYQATYQAALSSRHGNTRELKFHAFRPK
jgi:hypothetical protein